MAILKDSVTWRVVILRIVWSQNYQLAVLPETEHAN
jgi:hypothetical protein